MPRRSPKTFSLLASLLAVVLLAAGCGTGGDENAISAITPSVELLPDPNLATPSTSSALPDTTTPVAPATETSTTPLPIPTPEALSCLSARARVAQLLIPLATQAELFGARVFAADDELGGIGLLGSPDGGIGTEIEALQLASFVPLIIASDEEGGSVQRLANLLGPIPSAAETARSKNPEEVRSLWLEYGHRVRDLGITMVFGPVLDVGSGPGIDSRSFGDDPELVSAYGRAVAEGLLEAGVTPVFKHFPGHGRATADSHLELPTTPPLAELWLSDLIPYVELVADPVLGQEAGVMVGHLAVPGLSDATPTSLSPEAITGLLRSELGFGGLVITDAMNMGAILNTYGRLDALELAIRAGADMVIIGSLADLTPALDYLEMRAQEDPDFASIMDNRAARVLTSKGQESICMGAQ